MMKNINKYPVNLLDSNFKMRHENNMLQNNIINFWKKKKIFNYYNLKFNRFILHDGPPFANGNIHLGHVLNKILKDIIIRYKNFINYKSIYILGWDCFGIPIENKFKNHNNEYNLIKFYNLIKNYVEKIIKRQKLDFYNLGLLTNYNYIYKTINYRNSSEEIKLIYNFNKKKYFQRDYKIMYWCHKCKTQLNNSNIIFNKKIDFSMTVIFYFIFFPYKFFIKKKIYIIGGLLVWTTLPWTLLLNQGLCLNSEKFYICVNTIKGIFIINLQKYILYKKKYKNKLYLYKIFIGYNIPDLLFINPIYKLNKYFYKKIKLYKNKNIKNLGTEIIHISPNHGLDDYKLYKNYNTNYINIKNLFYINGQFKYKNIFYKKNINYFYKFIIEYLSINNKFFIKECYKHKYMFCKKDNTNIIYKLTKQWYILYKKKIYKNIKNKINKISFNNKYSKKKFINTLYNRPKWNIFRQKSWGITIPNIIDKKFNYNYILKFFSNYYELYGGKYWYELNKIDIIYISIYFKKLFEVSDVWFDSGTTHWHVIRGSHKNLLKFPSDLYLEGEDQYRGWFQTSFITSILLNNKVPFKNLLSHNFIKTIYGEKFSKSLNNFVDYRDLIDLIGIDLIRLLISNVKYNNVIFLSNNLLKTTIEIYRKIRNCVRFFLTNISTFNYNIKLNKIIKKNLIINELILFKFNILIKKLLLYYNKYNFKKVLLKLKKFLFENLSSFYFDIIKNYLYLDVLNSKKRKLILTTLFLLLKKILIIISPILPFISEESWGKLFINKTILYNKYYISIFTKKNIYIFVIIKYIKYLFYKLIELIKLNYNFKNLDLKLYIFINYKTLKILKTNKFVVKYLFSISRVTINLYQNYKIKFLYKFIKKNKCIRCWIKKKYIYNKNICKSCYIKLYKQLFYN